MIQKPFQVRIRNLIDFAKTIFGNKQVRPLQQAGDGIHLFVGELLALAQFLQCGTLFCQIVDVGFHLLAVRFDKCAFAGRTKDDPVPIAYVIANRQFDHLASAAASRPESHQGRKHLLNAPNAFPVQGLPVFVGSDFVQYIQHCADFGNVSGEQ